VQGESTKLLSRDFIGIVVSCVKQHGGYGVIAAQGFVDPLAPEHNRIVAP